MNGNQLAEEALGLVQDPTFDEDAALLYLNQGMKAVAGAVLLPMLADGYATVQTSLIANTVAMPVDYHRELFQAQIGGYGVRVSASKSLLLATSGLYGVGLASGAVVGVTVDGGQLLYQKVPSVVTNIELFYYRLPVAITASDTSFADGLSVTSESNDHFDMALVHYAASRMFSKVEGGAEGKKANAEYHMEKYAEILAEIDLATSGGRSRSSPPICGMGNW